MKVSRNIIIILLIFCAFLFGVIILLEFNSQVVEKISKSSSHIAFYLNVSLSLFASGVLVIVPTITQYITEKRRYYIEMQKNLNSILYHSREIIECISNYAQANTIHMRFESFRICYKELIAQYSLFTYFIIFSNKDKLIETIITDVHKLILIIEEILNYSEQLKKNEITEVDYNNCFKIVRDKMINEYGNNFKKYQELIDKYMTTTISEKKLKKYF